MDADWSDHEGPSIAVWSVPPEARVQVRPTSAVTAQSAMARLSMAGTVVRDGDRVWFRPRFPFVAGTSYTVFVDGVAVAELVRPAPPPRQPSRVAAIYPSGPGVPRNLLRCYVWFTAPMREGEAANHVRFVAQTGEELAGALLSSDYELWDPARRRLTVLLDPARIKQGLVPHRALGYPLRSDESVSLVIDAGFRDADGRPLGSTAQQHFRVGPDERRRVDPAAWAVAAPMAGTTDELRVDFDRPLDHGLLLHSLRVFDPTGRVEGTVTVGPQERSWMLRPARPWTSGPHRIVVDPALEDLAGNSLARVFDREVGSPSEVTPEVVAVRPFFIDESTSFIDGSTSFIDGSTRPS